MAKKVKATVLSGTENLFKITVSRNAAVIDHTQITAAKLRSNTGLTLADSEVDATDWDFTNVGFLTVKLGLTSLPTGSLVCYLILKDAQHPTGEAWETELHLTVIP